MVSSHRQGLLATAASRQASLAPRALPTSPILNDPHTKPQRCSLGADLCPRVGLGRLAVFSSLAVRLQHRPLLSRYWAWHALFLVPSHNRRPRLGDCVALSVQKRLVQHNARATHALNLDYDRRLLLPEWQLPQQIHLDPDDHVNRRGAEGGFEEPVSALFQVGQKDRVVDVTERIAVSPPDCDWMRKRRVGRHGRILSSRGSWNRAWMLPARSIVLCSG